MLSKFLNRKKHTKDTSVPPPPEGWAVVILKPLRSDVKDSLVNCVADAFEMSPEESANILANTPIILLDGLEQETAVLVKKHFKETGAEIFLTNDLSVKGKCFRTVWPEPPPMSFLIKSGEFAQRPLEAAQGEPSESYIQPAGEEPLPTEKEAEPELNGMELAEEEPAAPLGQGVNSQELRENFNQWKENYEQWKASFQGLNQEVEQIRLDRESLYENVESAYQNIQEREQEISAQKDSFRQLEEKYQVMQQEIRNERGQLEQRLADLSRELHEWKTKAAEVVDKLGSFEGVRADLEKAYQEQQKKYAALEEDYENARGRFNEVLSHSSGEVMKWKSEADALTGRIQELEASRQNLETALNEQRQKYVQLEQEYQESRKRSQEKKVLSAGEYDEWRERERKMAEKLEMLEKLQMQMILDMQERLRKESFWESKANLLTQGLNDLKQIQEHLKSKVSKPRRRAKKPNESAPETGTGI